MTDAVVYKLYSHRPLSTAANQQLAVSTGTIATYFGNLAPPCGCLHTEVHELCVRALSADISARSRSLHIRMVWKGLLASITSSQRNASSGSDSNQYS